MIFEIGRLCMKLAGRDAGKQCVVVEVVDPNYVIIDGETRRKKVNVKHLEPLNEIFEIQSGAGHADVAKVFEKLGVKVWNTKKKESKERPKKLKTKKERPVKTKKTEKKDEILDKVGKEQINQINKEETKTEPKKEVAKEKVNFETEKPTN
jgi:large subunit ribosomal protein L14e